MLTLVRTEHIGFRAYLTKRGVPGITPQCTCNQGTQTLKHICIFCPELQRNRYQLFLTAGSNSWEEISSTKRGLLATARWLIREGVLEQFSLAREEEKEREERGEAW